MKDRVAVVTGAASGIGCATAARLAREGCHLALVDVDGAGLERTAETARAAGVRVSVHVADVSDRERMRALVGEVIAAHGAVHVLVNNAGVTVTGPFADHSLDNWDWIVGVNLWGVVHGCHFFLPHLVQAEEAHIVNVSSLFGIIGVPGQTSYCATKYAVRGLSEALAEELDGTHVGITVVHPGGIATNIISSSRAHDQAAKAKLTDFFRQHTMQPEAAADQIVGAILKKRPRLVITAAAVVADWLKRVFPVGGNRLAVRAALRTMGVETLRGKIPRTGG